MFDSCLYHNFVVLQGGTGVLQRIHTLVFHGLEDNRLVCTKPLAGELQRTQIPHGRDSCANYPFVVLEGGTSVLERRRIRFDSLEDNRRVCTKPLAGVLQSTPTLFDSCLNHSFVVLQGGT
eukprot:Rhum_TRINITY_DN15153_c3_g3::Rhum_TRINITY_DN15153_c3_g3_i16::g.140934::m.140934